ncbi:hypothetical protein [Thermomonospora umbrina]|uniref:Uncharacterized protein n=1 Tax=Thermomonospora umbrina TaxID=111806 RepID=A0A3D9SYC0_9ACTN|nr:hypothetical protein [Thermomonospora umbrina]REF00568.1 hypothetical protein DFJ69_6118 [Thermomonospora umbrina]
MALRFLCIDPGTNGGNCPAVFMDEETGDLLFQGWTETNEGTLTEASTHSPMAARESMVRLPARMKTMVLEALSAAGKDVR